MNRTKMVHGIAANGQGNVYVTGLAGTDGFPITSGAAQTRDGGISDAFVASYAANGKLRWATYLGGTGDDAGQSIAADGQGSIYVTGDTDSVNFPITPVAVQPHGDGGVNSFVASYLPNGRLRWATYLGGKGDDECAGIAADDQGNLYVTSNTDSIDFPSTRGTIQPHGTGGDDAFVAFYMPNGRLRWTTYLGGMVDDEGHSITVDDQGNLYATDDTLSASFPITPGAAQTIYGGNGDVFVGRLVLPAASPIALELGSPSPADTAYARFFSQTHHTLASPFLASWNHLGGLSTLGLPLPEPFTLAGKQVQVTERAVLVLANGKIQLLPLSSMLSASDSFASIAPESSTTTLLYFPTTRHSLASPFLAYWLTRDGSELLGAPIGEPQREGLGDGRGQSYSAGASGLRVPTTPRATLKDALLTPDGGMAVRGLGIRSHSPKRESVRGTHYEGLPEVRSSRYVDHAGKNPD